MTDKKPFGKISFPSIRKVFSTVLVNQITSVQPMTMPVTSTKELPNYGPFCLGQKLVNKDTGWAGREKFFSAGDVLVVTRIEESENGLADWFYNSNFEAQAHRNVRITYVNTSQPLPERNFTASYTELKNCFFPDYEEVLK